MTEKNFNDDSDEDQQPSQGMIKAEKLSPDIRRIPGLGLNSVDPVQRIQEVKFACYPDGTLQLFKPGSILSETPAGYSEEKVTVKALVRKNGEKFMVVIPVYRSWLDHPGAAEELNRIALSWSKE
jgi:hypothetical protein